MTERFQLTKTFHVAPYPAISPKRPELSQAGQTVLVTGGSMGIGFEIARAFVQAGARKVIIVARRAAAVDAAVEKLRREAQTTATEVEGRTCDQGDLASVAELWGALAGAGTAVDVLVLNAASISPVQTILELGVARLWRDYEVNVRGQLDMTERFYKQKGRQNKKPLYLVHVSTLSIHDFSVGNAYPGYGLTKNGSALALQVTAQDVPAADMQIVSYHPGAIFTEAAERNGFTKDSIAWQDGALSGQFAVWAATPDAAFLHGRFVWANWDVEGLKTGELRKRIDEDPEYLKIGVNGL
ncbi:NAD(P)-binding protein [Hypoxylon sp. FL1284]|nr:NAD(P)-binding protein [Hypoxylon sp. FL1284]